MESDYSFSQQTQTQTQAPTQSQPSQLSSSSFPAHLWGLLIPSSATSSSSTLSVSAEQKQGSIIELAWAKTELRIGRHPISDLKLTNTKISTHHAKIWYDDDEKNVKVTDLSTNGTWVRDRRVGKNKTTIIEDGDTILFGPASADFVSEHRYIFRGAPRIAARSGRPWDIDERQGPGIYGKYEVREQIGKGSFAIVWRGLERETGKSVAIKVIEKARFMSNPKTMEMLAREVEIVKQLKHRNCVQCYDHFEDEKRIWIVLEYVDGGDLLEFVMKTGPSGLSVKETRTIALDVCGAVAYLHSHGITHRDLKPENLLLTRGVKQICKVTDFGLAKVVHEGTMLRTMCGTPTYLAPEVVENDSATGYSPLVDAWSIGVILYSCLTCQTPFEEDESTPLKERMRQREVDWNWLIAERNIDPIVVDFLRKLLVNNPRERMSVTDALNHPWLRVLPSDQSQGPPRESQQQADTLGNLVSNGELASSVAGLQESESNASIGVSPLPPNSFVDSQGMHNLRLEQTGCRQAQNGASEQVDGAEVEDYLMTDGNVNNDTTIGLENNLDQSTIVPRAQPPPEPLPEVEAPESPSVPQKRKELPSAFSSSSEGTLNGGSSHISLDSPSGKINGSSFVPPLAPVFESRVSPEKKEVDSMSLASSELSDEQDAGDESELRAAEPCRRSSRRTSTAMTPNRRTGRTSARSGGRKTSTSSSNATSRASIEPTSPITPVEGVMTRRRAKMAKVA